jgi:hypothetical protein
MAVSAVIDVVLELLAAAAELLGAEKKPKSARRSEEPPSGPLPASDWPSGPVREEYDSVDLGWHELEFRENYSFTYAVYDVEGLYVGCCYFYPIERRTALDDTLLPHDLDVSRPVTPDAYRRGCYEKLYLALQQWIANAFPSGTRIFSNREIP